MIIAGIGSLNRFKGRIDFDLPESGQDKEALAQALNKLVDAALEVTIRAMPESEYAAVLDLTRTQALAPPVVGGQVRIVEIAGVDLQPCGGTHVQNTREIGHVVVEKIEKKSKTNRRVSLRFAE